VAKLKTTAADMVKDARERIREIETKDLIALLEDENVVIVDLRDVRERQKLGFIPKSFHCPRGMVEFWVDPASPYFKDIFAQEKHFVFHCASGWRSALTVSTLMEMGFENISHLREGFTSWKEMGAPIEYYDAVPA